MSIDSSIEWTDATWNPVTGCTKVSPGCKHCYAERLAHRLKAMGNPRYTRGFALSLHPDLLKLRPLRPVRRSKSGDSGERVTEPVARRASDDRTRPSYARNA